MEKEINSSWPYPNKDRKQVKVNALTDLIKNISQSSNESLSALVQLIEETYPNALKGNISHRVADLFTELKVEQTVPLLN